MQGGAAVVEERMKILEMVAAGTLTADEANRLWEALERIATANETVTTEAGRPPTTGAGRSRVNGWPSRGARRREQDPIFGHEQRDGGFGGIPPSTLIELRQAGVKPAFIRGLYDAGLADLSSDRIIELWN